jgi:hypothetical protein
MSGDRTWRVGVDRIPLLWVLVRCKRCHRPVAKYWEDLRGEGEWERRNEGACTCDPPPVLPQGGELARLVKLARRKDSTPGRAPVSVSR